MTPKFETQYVSALSTLFASLEEKETENKEEIKLLIRKELKKRKAELEKTDQEEVDQQNTDWPQNIVDDLLAIKFILEAKIAKHENGLVKTRTEIEKLVKEARKA